MEELRAAIKTMHLSKAAGIDGIYPEMIAHLSTKALEWLAGVMSDAIKTGRYCHLWRRARVLAILKPSKPAEDPDSYRPISLLCCTYKLLERIVLSRITPIVDPEIPPEQAGFRANRSTVEQIVALTSLIESGFEKKLKTGAVFVDLSSAYDTVWREGLMYKLANIIKDQRLLKLIARMTGTRTFLVSSGGENSSLHKLKNGVPQGSVLAPTLFNVYMRDLPETLSWKLGYADDWAIVSQANTIPTLEMNLSTDMTILSKYFDRWYLKMNIGKTVTTVFHLNNREANLKLRVTADGRPLPNESKPKYLGITLDRSLTFKDHLENSKQKLKKRTSIIRKLTGTTWGASQNVLRTSAVALCYSVAEYGSPAWARSSHTSKVDTLLNENMRLISGTLKSTPLEWLPTMCNIAPPAVRREEANQKLHNKIVSAPPDLPIARIIDQAPTSSRLRSRKPFYKSSIPNYNANTHWRETWEANRPTNGLLIQDPTLAIPGFATARRREWAYSNRLLSKHGRTNQNLARWGMSETAECPRCGHHTQDTDHIILECPHTAIDGGYQVVLRCDEHFRRWLLESRVEV